MAGQIAFQLVADDAEAQRKLEQFISSFEGSAKRVEKGFGSAGSLADQFGQKIMTAAVGGASAFAVIEATIGRVNSLLMEMNRIAEEGAMGRMTKEQFGRELVQTASSPAEFKSTLGTVNQVRQLAGVDANTAQRWMTALNNAGLGAEWQTAVDASKINMNPETMVNAAAGLTGSFAGGDQVGSFRAIINKLGAASIISQINPERISEATSLMAPAAKGIGATDEETIAAATAIASAMGNNPERAGTAGRAFADWASANGLGGKGFRYAVEQINKENLSEQALISRIPEDRARAGYKALRDRADYFASQEKIITEAQFKPVSEDYLTTRGKWADMMFGSELRKRQAEQMRMIAEESSTASGDVLGYETGVDMADAQAAGAGYSRFSRAIGSTLQKTMKKFGGGEQTGRFWYDLGVNAPTNTMNNIFPVYQQIRFIRKLDEMVSSLIGIERHTLRSANSGNDVTNN